MTDWNDYKQIVADLRMWSDDPMWAHHVELPKVTLRTVALAIERQAARIAELEAKLRHIAAKEPYARIAELEAAQVVAQKPVSFLDGALVHPTYAAAAVKRWSDLKDARIAELEAALDAALKGAKAGESRTSHFPADEQSGETSPAKAPK